jgi:hypothetical protein
MGQTVDRPLDDSELKSLAEMDRNGLDLSITWTTEEMLETLRRANKLPLVQLRALLEAVGIHFDGMPDREDCLSALDEADDKRHLEDFLGAHRV